MLMKVSKLRHPLAFALVARKMPFRAFMRPLLYSDDQWARMFSLYFPAVRMAFWAGARSFSSENHSLARFNKLISRRLAACSRDLP